MTTSMFDKFLNARPLDVHTWSDYPEVNTFVNHIYSRLKVIDGNVRINKKNLKVVLLDLFEPPPLKWSAPIVRKAEDEEWRLRDPSPKRLS